MTTAHPEVRITGYSERGAVNALLYEIAYSKTPLGLLEDLLALAHFAGAERVGAHLTHAHVLIEQSLSDFGDADAILLLDAGERKSVVFLEAKVKSSSAEAWTLEQEFEEFKRGCGTERGLSSSNLFTQLYHKARLAASLTSADWLQCLDRGLDFPPCSTKATRRIGRNSVVLSAVQEIVPYASDVWYLSLVPDTARGVSDFFRDLGTRPWPLGAVPDPARWGGLAWEEVVGFCGVANLPNTTRVLEFNGEQICSAVKPTPS